MYYVKDEKANPLADSRNVGGNCEWETPFQTTSLKTVVEDFWYKEEFKNCWQYSPEKGTKKTTTNGIKANMSHGGTNL